MIKNIESHEGGGGGGESSRTVTKDDLANETVEGRGDEQHGAANVRVTSAGCPD